jgi:peptidoglycan/LPS O-acetylase OafA/YrhL
VQDRTLSDELGLWIDAFRWLAALSVLVTHVGIRMWAPISALPRLSWRQAIWAFGAGFDHQAVIIFFVLSGFLVGGAALRELKGTGRIAYGAYAFRRFVRLTVVFWPALLLGTACTMAAASLGGTDPPSHSLSWTALVCNASFLQTAICYQWAGNGALWSLFNEYWYYMLFPPLAVAVLGRQSLARRAALGGFATAALVTLTAAQFTGAPLALYMLIWLAGVAAAVVNRSLLRHSTTAASLLVFGLLSIRLFVRREFAGSHPIGSFTLDLAVALLFANLLLVMRHSRQLRPPPGRSLHRTLAQFSFSLYCTHIPVLTVALALLHRLTGLGHSMVGDGAPEWLCVGGVLAFCIGFAWCFAQLTEVHTDRLRTLLVRAGQPSLLSQ